jgi:hypothetical protein
MLPSSGSSGKKSGLLERGDEGSTFLRNIGGCVTVGTASDPRKLESSSPAQWGPLIWHRTVVAVPTPRKPDKTKLKQTF